LFTLRDTRSITARLDEKKHMYYFSPTRVIMLLQRSPVWPCGWFGHAVAYGRGGLGLGKSPPRLNTFHAINEPRRRAAVLLHSRIRHQLFFFSLAEVSYVQINKSMLADVKTRKRTSQPKKGNQVCTATPPALSNPLKLIRSQISAGATGQGVGGRVRRAELRQVESCARIGLVLLA